MILHIKNKVDSKKGVKIQVLFHLFTDQNQ